MLLLGNYSLLLTLIVITSYVSTIYAKSDTVQDATVDKFEQVQDNLAENVQDTTFHNEKVVDAAETKGKCIVKYSWFCP